MKENLVDLAPRSRLNSRAVYLAGLGIINGFLLLLMVFAYSTGNQQTVLAGFLTIYTLLFYLLTHTTPYLYADPGLLLGIVLLGLLLLTSGAFYGAWRRRPWGRRANILYLATFFPTALVIPAGLLWRLPDTRLFFPLPIACPLALGLLIFNAWYLVWWVRSPSER